MRDSSSSAIAARHILASGNPESPPSGTNRCYTFRAMALPSEVLAKVSTGHLSIPAAERLLSKDAAAESSEEFDGSVFDPVLCELAYLWFCPAKGVALDPFSGSAVSGIVASKLGINFFGIELRKSQVAKNRQRADALKLCPRPKWIEGSSTQMPCAVPARCDFIL